MHPYLRKALQHVGGHFARQASHHFSLQAQVNLRVGAAADVHDHPAQRFVQRYRRSAEPRNARALAEGTVEGLRYNVLAVKAGRQYNGR